MAKITTDLGIDPDGVEIVKKYVDDVVWRSRRPMEPVNYHVAWSDRPRAQKFYRGAASIELESWGNRTPEAERGSGTGFGVGQMAAMLHDSYAWRDRRLTVYANLDVDSLPEYKSAAWSRGAASGGSRYPVTIYWVVGQGAEIDPGIYFYSPDQHCLRLLLSGDATGTVAHALRSSTVSSQYLILGNKFWQNAYKYNSFAYHAVSMDIGTALEAFAQSSARHGLEFAPHFWFDESEIALLLNVDNEVDEGVFCVLDLDGMTSDRAAQPMNSRSANPSVTLVEEELSETVSHFPVLHTLQRTMAVNPVRCPNGEDVFRTVRAASSAAGADTERMSIVGLPRAKTTELGPEDVLRERRSSFGRFTSALPLQAEALSALLQEGADAGRLRADILEPDNEGTTVELFVFVNHVDGVPPGLYRFLTGQNALESVAPGPDAGFLQANYFLENYNPEQAAAVIVPVIRTPAFIEALGPRGYRVANAVGGAVTQRLYDTSSALGIGCGAALGFDNVSYIDKLGLNGSDRLPLIMVMVGPERPGTAAYRYELP